ncbi:hypothetical protein GCM10027294_25380 [Marinactinospora endophytica]
MTEPKTATPTAEQVGDWEPGSPEWHAARATRLGGSEIAAILGLSPWESRFSLWHRKRGTAEPQAENARMSWGKRLEAPIAEAFADFHPEFEVVGAGTYVSTARPYQLANPDRLLVPRDGGPVELLEVKTAREDGGWGEPGTDEIPIYYRCQVLWYLDTLGLSRAHVAVLIAGSDYREYVIDLDPADPDQQVELATLRTEADLFMRSVRDGVRPGIDSSTATYQVIRRLPDAVVDEDVEIPPELAEDYLAAVDAHRAAEAVKRRLCSQVLDLIGDRRRATVAGERIATRVVNPDGTTKSLMPARKKDI